MNEIGMKGSEALQLTNVCSVLAEADIINLLELGRPLEDIVAGVFEGLANRAVGLLSRVGVEDEVALTGGVSNNRAIIKAIETRLGRSVNTGVDGIYAGALGAAILGLEQATNNG